MNRTELLKLLSEQSDAGADLLQAAERLDEVRVNICARHDAAWVAVYDNEKGRRRTMQRILEVSMGKVDPGPREVKP